MTRSPALTTLTATVHMMTRRQNTANGGPRYYVTTTNGVTFQTAPDTADSTAWVPERIVGQLVTLTLDSRDRIVGIEPATAPDRLETATLSFDDGSDAVWFLTAEQINAVAEYLTATYGPADQVGP